ncbi:phosphopantetheine-binding protein [Pseudomonas chlororaphis subsp. aureofaciens]|uniref:phosphopantetheine-binding protein n=1 Tax=Pseudomonas TaxID=286 RepID=UPI00235FACA5|nr:phosphopantetheine-binding protein [Pseudomonas sp. SBT1-2]
MKSIDIKTLMEFLKNSGEQDESSQVSITEEHADFRFDELGFDSLALLNVVEHLKQKHGLDIGYDIAVTAETPQALLRIIQGGLFMDVAR